MSWKTKNLLRNELTTDGDPAGEPPPAPVDGGGTSDDGGDFTGFQDASAENLSDLLGDGWGEPTAPASRPEGIPTGTDTTSAPKPAEPAPVAKPAEPVAAEPAQAPVQPVEPQAQPPVQPEPQVQAPQEPQAPVEPAQPAKTSEQVQAERLENRTKFVEQLTQAYSIPEAEVDELRDTPETYLPKVAAKLHADIFDSLYHGLVQQLPQLVDTLITTRTTRSTDEERFFSKWKSLNTPELRPKVMEKVKQYRQLNPALSKEQFEHEAGMWAHMALRIPLDAPATPGNGTGNAPAQPSARPAAKPVPFQPAGANAAATGIPTAPTKDPWNNWVDEMAQDR